MKNICQGSLFRQDFEPVIFWIRKRLIIICYNVGFICDIWTCRTYEVTYLYFCISTPIFVCVARIVVNPRLNLALGLNFVRPWYYSWLDSCVLLTGECIQNKACVCPHASHTACFAHLSLVLYVVWCGWLRWKGSPSTFVCFKFLLPYRYSCTILHNHHWNLLVE